MFPNNLGYRPCEAGRIGSCQLEHIRRVVSSSIIVPEHLGLRNYMPITKTVARQTTYTRSYLLATEKNHQSRNFFVLTPPEMAFSLPSCTTMRAICQEPNGNFAGLAPLWMQGEKLLALPLVTARLILCM